MSKNTKLCGLVLITLAMPGKSLAADALEEITVEERIASQAVSDVNAKLEASYLHVNFDDGGSASNLGGDGKGYLLQGAVSLPVGQSFGLQIDAGTLNSDFDNGELGAHGIGAHLFWRDPNTGLLGLYGHHVNYDGEVETERLGVELEVYNGALSFEAFAGVDRVKTSFGDENYNAGDATIAWYATDNFRLSAGVAHSFERTSAVLGVEAMADTGGFSPSLYANASFSNEVTSYMAGVKIYLGKSKSLKARHREDDPAIGLFDNFGAMASCLSGGSTGGFNLNSSLPVTVKAKVLPSVTYELDGCDISAN